MKTPSAIKKMIVLVIAQEKGGVGKTTLAKIISEYFANIGLRLLLLDADPQGNFSARFIDMESDPDAKDGYRPPINPDYDPNEEGYLGKARSSIADIYESGHVITYTSPRFANVEVIPSSGERIRDIELVRKSELEEKVHHRLRSWLAQPGLADMGIDIVIIDTPPNKGPVTTSALMASTHLLIPAKMEHSTMEGLRGMIQFWRELNRGRTRDKTIKLVGLVPNMVRKVALHDGIMASIKNDDAFAPYILEEHLSERIAYAEVDHPDNPYKSVFEYPKTDPVHKESLALCKAIERRLYND